MQMRDEETEIVGELKVGDVIPDFSLKDQNENEVKLSELRGKKVLLSFHPMAFTAICADQMRSLEGNYKNFNLTDTVALGVSIDSVPVKKAWAKELGITKTPLLADFWPHGEVARKLGLFLDDKGVSKRANVILDEEGKVIFLKVYPIKELPDIREIIDFLEEKR
jgi:peroxiredoxin